MPPNHYVYKLIPPRPTFAADMSEAERATMAEHGEYWDALFERGSVVVFGVVIDQSGAWGLAVLQAESEEEVRAIASEDPAVKARMCAFDIGTMPQPLVPDLYAYNLCYVKRARLDPERGGEPVDSRSRDTSGAARTGRRSLRSPGLQPRAFLASPPPHPRDFSNQRLAKGLLL